MSAVVVLSVILASALSGLEDPNLIASLATLVTALTGLIVAVRASSTGRTTRDVATRAAHAAEGNQAAIATVQEQTNGQLAELRAHVVALREQAAQAGLPPLPSPGQASGTTGSASSG